ncbi:TOMM precursor leader peptide-binding protein [Micromonospora zamorensis]|uniref:TOMM precursor leader peptide-binding protein n=1 Tax=Micromonospora zamorensis TaxID=709883 RepID=UPI0037A68761
MRVKLRDDLMYVATENGVYLETGTASTELTGAAAYGLIQRLAPHLDGSSTLNSLTAGLPPAQQRLISDMAQMLVQRGLARDLDSDPSHSLQDWELFQYREAIAFAEHVTDAPLSRFETFRNGRVLLVGAGSGMFSLVSTLFELGLRTATLVETMELSDSGDAYRRIVEDRRVEDPTVELRLVEPAGDPLDDDRLEALLAGHDAVLHCADEWMTDRALRLTRAARERGVPVLHALPVGQEAWVGPTGGGATGGCWECALLSLEGAGNPGKPGPDGGRPDLAPQWLSAPVAGLVGAALGFAYLRNSTGAETPATNRMTRIDLETAVTSEHLLAVHPRCGSCPRPTTREVGARIDAIVGRPPIDLDTFVNQVPLLVDSRLGPLLSIDTGQHSQISVSYVEANVADLAGAGTGPAVRTAVGGSRRQALTRAAAAAMELLAAQARPAPGDAAAQAGHEWWDPDSGEAFTATPAASHLAIGLTWAEACGRALLRLRRAAAAAPAAATGPARDDPPGIWLDPALGPEQVQVMAQEMALLGHQLRAWRDLSSTPTVFVGADTGWLAHSCATDPDVALEYATQAAVAALTGRRPDGADIGPDLGADVWDALLPSLLREVAASGQRLALRPADEVATVRRIVPFIVEAALLPSGRSAR